MDNKFKLNAKMNVNLVGTDFWLAVAETTCKVAMFATKQAIKLVKKNADIAEQMLEEDYPESFKTQLEELFKKVEL